MAETIQFKIDGEWLTNFVRQRVYYENVSFEEGIKTFRSFFKDLSYALAFDLLSGRKKLTGVNEFFIIEDNKTDEYKKYVQKKEQERKRKQLREVFDKYGIITPEGEFLECEYGAHSATAYDYCLNKGWLDFKKVESGSLVDYLGTAKDILYHAGFIFVNEINHKFYSKYNNTSEMPQAVQNTIYEYLVWEDEIEKGVINIE